MAKRNPHIHPSDIVFPVHSDDLTNVHIWLLLAATQGADLLPNCQSVGAEMTQINSNYRPYIQNIDKLVQAYEQGSLVEMLIFSENDRNDIIRAVSDIRYEYEERYALLEQLYGIFQEEMWPDWSVQTRRPIWENALRQLFSDMFGHQDLRNYFKAVRFFCLYNTPDSRLTLLVDMMPVKIERMNPEFETELHCHSYLETDDNQLCCTTCGNTLDMANSINSRWDI